MARYADAIDLEMLRLSAMPGSPCRCGHYRYEHRQPVGHPEPLGCRAGWGLSALHQVGDAPGCGCQRYEAAPG